MRRFLPILLALVCVPAALSATPRVQTIAGTISANTGASITVSTIDRSLTCRVLGEKARTALARWGVGVKAAMACQGDAGRLVLSRLKRLDTNEHKDGTTTTSAATGTTTREHSTTTGDNGTTTGETHTTPPPPPPTSRRDARGKVSALGAGFLTVTRGDGTSLTCSVSDDQARELAKGAPVGTPVLIVCAGTGDHPALLTLQPDSSSPPPPPTTTTAPTPPPTTAPDRREARGIVTSLSSTDGVTVRPDAGGDSLHCRITPANDSVAAASKLSLGAHVGIVCRRDGDSYVLSGTTLIS